MPTPTRLLAFVTALALLAGARPAVADEPVQGSAEQGAPAEAAPVPSEQQAPVAPATTAAPAAPATTTAAPATTTAAPAPAAVAPAAKDVTTEKTEDVPRPSWKLCLGLGVGGAALLVSGIVLGGLAKARSNELEGNVDSPPLYDKDYAARGREGDRMATAAYVMFGVGGALAIADVVLLVERYRKAPKKKDGAQARTIVTPTATGLRVSF